MILALTIAIILGTILGAILYGRRQQKAAQSMTEWAVGGRRFGVFIFWFLNAGEIYTTFAVLGISGYAWAFGAPAYLAFTSVSLAATVGYLLMPRIWAAGKKGDLVTQADFFADHYRAPWLGIVVGLAGIAALIVYVQIQIVALSLIVRLTLGEQVGTVPAAIIAAGSMLLFVYFAGLRSAAFAAAVKDILMLVIVIGLCLTVADRVGASSLIDVYRLAQDSYPGIGHLPGLQPDAGLSTTWLMTAALNVALGTWVLPHMFQLCYSSGTLSTIRRNAIWQPLYSLSYFFIILLGFAALLAGTQPLGGDPNAVLIEFVAETYPSWAVGLFAGTACLLALVPGSVLLLTAGSIFSRNVAAPLFPAMGERTSLFVSRGAMIVSAAISVYLTLGGSESLVEIGLSAYAAIGMLAPGVFLAFLWPRAHAGGVFAGIVAGYIALLLPAAQKFWNGYFPEWDHGLLAMAVGFIVTIAVCLVWTPARTAPQPASA
ncbi:sodium:solute symporter [Pacificimonas flava]|uniref:Sodium:solute symporter n=2 Tax=Pacificimonas TaxID=1960290 RepID=A0A219B5M7_9SPHN|nr:MULTISPECIES: sodium:solute symporter family protein [Pacificimonas]MBZ6379186.1 sodium:solute symporter family protein [Pacificimonas aurantium]OWV33591.1 sodium:solute symporter [Pacificimonas flava]